MIPLCSGIPRYRKCTRSAGKVTSQSEHCIDKERRAVNRRPWLNSWFSSQEISVKQTPGESCKIGVVPIEVHVDQVNDQLRILGHFGPTGDGVLVHEAQGVGFWLILNIGWDPKV